MHIALINPIDGEVCLQEVFDTYKSSESLNEFIKNGIPEEVIVVAACQDDCVTNLSEEACIFFMEMGSSEICDLEYR